MGPGWTALVAVALQVGLAGGAPEADVVERLPGWEAALLSKTYSGYIPVGSEDGYTMYEHYLFFESEGDPQTDPVIMWTNGGPGAPSMFGAFVELGPYFLCDASTQTAAYNATGVPTLFENAYRWTKLGNLLIRNLPPPIGFSYCDPAGPTGDGNSCGSWNDTKVARHSVAFMRAWMDKFPEYASRDLYLTGESYAGVYVPMLAREILQGGGALAAQLRGIAVGDGCLGGVAETCTPYGGPLFQVEFFHGHGQFSDRTYADIMRVCPREELLNGVTSPTCKASLDRMDEERGYSFAYNLYDECYDFDLGTPRWSDVRRYWGPAPPRHSGARRQVADAGGPGDWHMDGSPCGGTSVLTKWVAAPGVRAALHVAENARFFQSDNGVGFTYNYTEPSLATWYSSVISAKRIRVLVYNGDADPGLNSFYAQAWTSSLGIPEVEPWRPWTRDGQIKMGGSVTRYAGGFDFLTIRGAGHMVPEYKPEAAYVMLSSFLRGEEYPRYRPKAVAAAASEAADATELIV